MFFLDFSALIAAAPYILSVLMTAEVMLTSHTAKSCGIQFYWKPEIV